MESWISWAFFGLFLMLAGIGDEVYRLRRDLERCGIITPPPSPKRKRFPWRALLTWRVWRIVIIAACGAVILVFLLNRSNGAGG
ncbi:MAG: hypothetical protein U1E38_09415 [Rhodospirillales bacterium]